MGTSVQAISRLDIQVETWLRSTPGLFDYLGDLSQKDRLKVNHLAWVVSLGDNCILSHPSRFDLPERSKVLVAVQPCGKNFIIYQEGVPVSRTDSAWLAIRFLKNQQRGFELEVGQVLKMGRVKFKVKKICLQKEERCKKGVRGNEMSLVGLGESENQCRICLVGNEDENDPLIAPCFCSGSLEFVHINCIREWLKHRVEVRSNLKVKSYYWKDLQCQLCKQRFPSSVIVGSQQKDLFQIQEPSSNYLVLQDYRPEDNQSYAVHILSLLPKQSINIGRGLYNQLKLNDISISRKHSRIYCGQKKFYIKDLNSKFGTLVLVNKAILLNSGQKITLQINKSLLHFQVKTLFRCCSPKKNKIQSDFKFQDLDSLQEFDEFSLINPKK